jgi:hypothetical protein
MEPSNNLRSLTGTKGKEMLPKPEDETLPNQVGKIIGITPRLVMLQPQLTQGTLFAETQEETTTIENCQALGAPVIQTVKGQREWSCAFSAAPDLWNQDRNELIYARARTVEVVRMASHSRIREGDYATIVGIVTQTQDLVRNGQPTTLTFLNLTEIRPGLRTSSKKNRKGKKPTLDVHENTSASFNSNQSRDT